MGQPAFRYLGPELRVYQGGSIGEHLRTELSRAKCRAAFIVHAKSLARSALLERLRIDLGEMLCGTSDAVQAGSPAASVMTVAESLRVAGADAVIAVGGGSAIVTGRAAGILLAEGRDPEALCTIRTPDGQFVSPQLRAPKLPQFVLPTVPTTAIAKAGSALLESASRRRLALFDPKARAKAIFLNPDFLATAPDSIVFNAALHALCSGVEALESPRLDPFSEAFLLRSTKLLSEQLPRMTGGHDEHVDRSLLAYAAVMAGRDSDAVGGGVLSALTHAICSLFDAPNGWVAATLLPHCMRFNEAFTATRRTVAAEVFRVASIPGWTSVVSRDAADIASDFLDRLSVPRCLAIAGMTHERVHEVARMALSDWFSASNPRPIDSVEPICELLHNVFRTAS